VAGASGDRSRRRSHLRTP